MTNTRNPEKRIRVTLTSQELADLRDSVDTAIVNSYKEEPGAAGELFNGARRLQRQRLTKLRRKLNTTQ